MSVKLAGHPPSFVSPGPAPHGAVSPATQCIPVAGTYGKVHKVRNRTTGATAAAKVAELARKEQLMDFATEVAILTGCNSEGITNFVDGYYWEGSLWILIELAEGGSLSDLIKAEPFPEAAIRSVAHQMLTTLVFLHDRGVVHRDINASNTMVTANGLIKIGDFGVSAFHKKSKRTCRTFIGSPHWMAPEVIQCENDATKT